MGTNRVGVDRSPSLSSQTSFMENPVLPSKGTMLGIMDLWASHFVCMCFGILMHKKYGLFLFHLQDCCEFQQYFGKTF